MPHAMITTSLSSLAEGLSQAGREGNPDERNDVRRAYVSLWWQFSALRQGKGVASERAQSCLRIQDLSAAGDSANATA